MSTDVRASTPPASLPREQRASTTFLIVVTFVSLAADLASKGWAKYRLSGVDPRKMVPKQVEVIKGHLDFVYALNPGGAWSFLRSLPDSLRRPFFLFVSAAAIVFIISIYRRVPRDHTAMKWGLPLALGGAMGNLVDRIRYGSVIDFIDVYITRGGREIHWPTFNVADIAIVAGVALMVIDMMLPSRRRELAGEAAALPMIPPAAGPTDPASDTPDASSGPDAEGSPPDAREAPTEAPAAAPATEEMQAAVPSSSARPTEPASPTETQRSPTAPV